MLLLPFLALGAVTTGAMIPYVFTEIRNATKRRRREIIKDLDSGFGLQTGQAGETITSFEFVKYKYFFNEDDDRDFTALEWLVGAVPLVLVLAALNLFVLVVVAHQAFKIPIDVDVTWLKGSAPIPMFAWVVLVAYAGGVAFMLRAFNQAINNFDLSPLSFAGAVVNLVFGLVLAQVASFAVGPLPDGWTGLKADLSQFPVVLLVSFFAGYFPDVMLRTVIRVGHLQSYKSQNLAVFKTFKAIPTEVIDGIDSDISTRLADYHINSVQNLATANPLMLFVETPYGVYEIMDWVAQAQLCASVGSDLLPSFWRLGIRTIFDLERVVHDSACCDDNLLREIGAILWRDQDLDPKVRDGRAAADLPSSPPLATIRADLEFRLENPHVLRLRQIFNRVSQSLGQEARVLSSLKPRRPDVKVAA